MFFKNETNAIKFKLILADIFTIFISFNYAIFLKLETFTFWNSIEFFYAFLIIVGPSIFLNARLGLYRYFLRDVSNDIVFVSILASFASTCLLLLIKISLVQHIPFSATIIYGLLVFINLLIIRTTILKTLFRVNSEDSVNIAVYGAGSVGMRIIDELRLNPKYKVCMVIDDNQNNRQLNILGYRIESFKEASKKFKEKNIQCVLLAMPSINFTLRKKIISDLTEQSIKTITVPALNDLILENLKINDIKNVEIDELLGRKSVEANQSLLEKNIYGKTILVSGAGGTIGSELCLQIIKLRPSKLVIVDVSEFAIYEITNKLEAQAKKFSVAIVPCIGSIADRSFVSKLLNNNEVHTIYHTAAYKHVPLMELNPFQAIKNNSVGTFVFADEAIKHNVSIFKLISSDKAVNPTNIMGASKRLAERICITLNENQLVTRFSCVRFGNVLGSSGSVVQLFRKQINQGGPITLTHPDIIRYFMSVSEAVQLVIQASALQSFGEIFVLDMGEQVKIKDLAENMVKISGLKPYYKNDRNQSGDIEIKVTGLRHGEKMYEELSYGEDFQSTVHPRIKVVKEKLAHLDNLDVFINNLEEVIEKSDINQLSEILIDCANYQNNGS